MYIEERLESIDLTLKSLLTAIQSGAHFNAMATAEFAGNPPADQGGQATETNKRKRRTKAEIEADDAAEAAAKLSLLPEDPAAKVCLLPGDPAGTRYWVSESLHAVFVEKPGVGSPPDRSFKIESAEQYSIKKAEFEAKKPAATAAASSAAVATTAAAGATSNAGSTVDVPWDTAVASLKALAANPAHGSEAVLKLVKSIDPNAANVPALKDKGHNAKIVAAVDALLKPVVEGADPLFG